MGTISSKLLVGVVGLCVDVFNQLILHDYVRKYNVVNVLFTGYCCVFCKERDTHGDVLWSWVYPHMPLKLRSVIERRIGISWDSSTAVPFFSSQFQKQWHYCYTEDICLDKLPRVTTLFVSSL